MASDLDDLKDLFQRIGVGFTEEKTRFRRSMDQVKLDEIAHTITLSEGTGYSGFECAFAFNKDGKFISYAVYE